MTITATGHTIDVRTLAPNMRHATLLAAFKALAPQESLVIVNDHDPQPLRLQFQDLAPGQFSWVYESRGPELWRVCVQKVEPAPAGGSCCGHCGGA